jgi:hypothetical protein
MFQSAAAEADVLSLLTRSSIKAAIKRLAESGTTPNDDTDFQASLAKVFFRLAFDNGQCQVLAIACDSRR